MGTPNSWHKGAVRLNPIWVASTDLQPDEIISSWLVRSALVNGCDPMTLTWDIWPAWRPWTTDVDRWISFEKLVPLSRLSGIPPNALQLATLRPVASVISDTLPTNAIWPWILAIGSRGSRRRRGQQYCPQCLKEDEKPYFRLQWRFGWHTVCQKHKRLLLDRCPACLHSVQPHLLQAKDRFITICPECGAEFRRAESPYAHSDILSFQSEADSVVASGRGFYGDHDLSASEWFALVHFFSLLTRRLLVAATNVHKRLADNFGLTVFHAGFVPSRRQIELLCIHDRHQLLKGVAVLMQKGPVFLREALISTKATRQSFCPKGVRLPEVLQPIYEVLTNNSQMRKRSHSKKPFPQKPTSRCIVEKQMKHIMMLVKGQTQ